MLPDSVTQQQQKMDVIFLYPKKLVAPSARAIAQLFLPSLSLCVM